MVPVGPVARRTRRTGTGIVWADHEPADRHQGMVFPGEQDETWTYDRTAKAWYYHRFYDVPAGPEHREPRVRAEIKKIIAFWLQLGVAGFRMDAVPFIIELTEPGNPNAPEGLRLPHRAAPARAVATRRRGAAGRGERRAGPAAGLLRRRRRLGQPDPHAVRLHAQRPADARPGPAGPGADHRRRCGTPRSCRRGGQWATFLRNHDEIDLSRLTAEQRNEVFAAVRPGRGHAALRPGHPPPARPDARQRPAAHRAGVLAAVHAARHAGAALRRGDRHGRGPVAARAGTRSVPRCSGRTSRTPASPRRTRRS